jgi:hypothetical protein
MVKRDEAYMIGCLRVKSLFIPIMELTKQASFLYSYIKFHVQNIMR